MNQYRRLLTYSTLAILFCVISSTANAAEIQLLGIKLGSHGMKILQRYGNPTEIRVGGVSVTNTANTGAAGMRPGAAMPGAAAGPGMGMMRPGMGMQRPGGARQKSDAGSSINRLPRLLCSIFRFVSSTARTAAVQLFGTGNQGMSFDGRTQGVLMAADGDLNQMGNLGLARPGMGMSNPMAPGGGMAGMAGLPGMQGRLGNMANAQNAQNLVPAGGASVVWVYKFSNDRVAEFSLNSDGIVWQISIHGVKWPGQKTQKGVVLGSMYKDVLKKYGYPETHEQQGIQLMLHYNKKDRCVFTLVGRQVVGVTIALQ